MQARILNFVIVLLIVLVIESERKIEHEHDYENGRRAAHLACFSRPG
jgi:hypothetical protein